MRRIVQIVSFLVLLGSVAWVIHKPGYDSALAAGGSLTALLSSFFLKKDASTPTQRQKVTGNSIGIQAGRDVKADNFQRK